MPDFNVETALIPALLGLVGGVISGYLGGLITFRRQRRHDKEILAITLRNEVLHHVINLHKFGEIWRKETIDGELKADRDEEFTDWPFSDDHTEIYKANLTKIGLLSTDTARQVIIHYTRFRDLHRYMTNLLTPQPSASLNWDDRNRVRESGIDAMDSINDMRAFGEETAKKLTRELPLTNKARRWSMYVRMKNNIKNTFSRNRNDENDF